MLSNAFKVYERIIERRLKGIIEHQLGESQSEFRKRKQDHIFTIRRIIEKRKEQINQCMHLFWLSKKRSTA